MWARRTVTGITNLFNDNLDNQIEREAFYNIVINLDNIGLIRANNFAALGLTRDILKSVSNADPVKQTEGSSIITHGVLFELTAVLSDIGELQHVLDTFWPGYVPAGIVKNRRRIVQKNTGI